MSNQVTIDVLVEDEAIEKAEKLIELLKEAKTLVNELAPILENTI